MAPKRIVWVDDDFYALNVILRRLQEQSYNVVTIRTLSEAIEKSEQFRSADLVLLDLLIPSGDPGLETGNKYLGLQLLKYLADQSYKVPIIVLSIVTKPEVLAQARSYANVIDLVDKNPTPATVDDLFNLIRKTLA